MLRERGLSPEAVGAASLLVPSIVLWKVHGYVAVNKQPGTLRIRWMEGPPYPSFRLRRGAVTKRKRGPGPKKI